MSNTPNSTNRHRRTVLTYLGGAAVTLLAGCTGGEKDSSNESNQPSGAASGPLSNVAIDGHEIVVKLDADATVDRVTVIQPDGSEFDSTLVKTGVKTVSFDLETSYTPGEYRVLAVRDEESVGETSMTIQPELEIVEFGVGQNHPEKMPEELGNARDAAVYLRVQNKGNGPVAIKQLRLKGDIPSPTREKARDSGIYSSDSVGDAEHVLLEPGENESIYSTIVPFAFTSNSQVGCSDGTESGQFTVEISTGPGKGVQRSFSVTYSKPENDHHCAIEISG